MPTWKSQPPQMEIVAEVSLTNDTRKERATIQKVYNLQKMKYWNSPLIRGQIIFQK